MKKIIALLLVMLMVLSLAACHKNADNNDTPSTSTAVQIQNPDGYKDAIDLLVKCTIMGNTENLEKLAPEVFWLHHEKSGLTRTALIDQAKYASKTGHQYFQKILGETFTYTTTILSKETLDEATMATLSSCMTNQKGIPAELFTAAYKVTADVSLAGNSEIAQTLETVVYQIDGDWYCGNYYIWDDGTYVTFEIEGMIGG